MGNGELSMTYESLTDEGGEALKSWYVQRN